MKTFLNLAIPLWLLLAIGIGLGSWLGINAWQHHRTVNRMQVRYDSLNRETVALQADNLGYQEREYRIAQEARRRDLLQLERIRSVRDSAAGLRLVSQTRYVHAVSGAAPQLPAYLIPSVSPKMTVNLQVCYDSTAYVRITQSMGELAYRRETDRLRIEADVRKDDVIRDTDNTLARIEDPGWFKGRRRLARQARNRIRIWAKNEQTILDSIRTYSPNY